MGEEPCQQIDTEHRQPTRPTPVAPLHSRVVLVTGASRRIAVGAAIARRVVAAARNAFGHLDVLVANHARQQPCQLSGQRLAP